MPKIGFEAPSTVREVVDLMNRSGKWQLTLVDTDGRVYGHYETELFRTLIAVFPGQTMVYNGETDSPDGRVMFTANDDEEAFCFLYGCFLGIYGGKTLEAIQDELAKHRNERLV